MSSEKRIAENQGNNVTKLVVTVKGNAENKMPSIHLMCGFIGFGKTTIAKRLEKELPAVRFTHDEIMLERYGRNPEDFQVKYKLVDEDIRKRAEQAILHGQNVIMDYGFWNRETRKEYWEWAKTLTEDVFFEAVECDVELAKKRALKRSFENSQELFIDDNCFDVLLKKYEPISDDEKIIVNRHKGC